MKLHFTGQAQVLQVFIEGVVQGSTDTAFFFDAQQTVFSTTSCKISLCRNVRRRQTLQRRPCATLFALAQCEDRRLFHFNANLKKHLPISIRWLLSETESCKRCGCIGPEDVSNAERPGRGIYRFGVDRRKFTWLFRAVRLDRVAQRSRASTWCGHGWRGC